jgi:hypothetical protein
MNEWMKKGVSYKEGRWALTEAVGGLGVFPKERESPLLYGVVAVPWFCMGFVGKVCSWLRLCMDDCPGRA